MDTLILTGWGWKEYAVAAAVALKALSGKADVMGMSKQTMKQSTQKWPSKREPERTYSVVAVGDSPIRGWAHVGGVVETRSAAWWRTI